MAITAAQVKELRERTGLGMMDCKKALVATDGDIDKAIEDLRKSSALKADKKAGRIAADGAVAVKVADDGSYGVMIEINSETDFVARDENFQGFVNTILEAAFVQKQNDVAALMAGELETARAALVQKIGENITVRRIDIVDGGVVGSYVHGNGRIAVLSSVEGASQEIAKDVAMHAAATNPMVVNADDVPADIVAKEKEIYVAQAADSGKPPEIIEKMVTGRVRKYLAEVSLAEQAFVKNPDQKVGAMVKAAGGSVTAFVRYEVGEGIEKEVVDFADEVAAQVKQ